MQLHICVIKGARPPAITWFLFVEYGKPLFQFRKEMLRARKTYVSVHASAVVVGAGGGGGDVGAIQSNEVVGGNVVQPHTCPVDCVIYVFESPQSHHPGPLAMAAHVFCGSAS